MVWNDEMLKIWATKENGLEPYYPDNINPASVDLQWSGRFKKATPSGWTAVQETDELVIEPDMLYLLDTEEYVIMPEVAAGILMLKSSIGRNGLEHLHAGFFDPGFHGTATLEVKNLAPWPVTIKKGQRIVQLALIDLVGAPLRSYIETGRYNGQRAPQEERAPR